MLSVHSPILRNSGTFFAVVLQSNRSAGFPSHCYFFGLCLMLLSQDRTCQLAKIRAAVRSQAELVQCWVMLGPHVGGARACRNRASGLSQHLTRDPSSELKKPTDTPTVYTLQLCKTLASIEFQPPCTCDISKSEFLRLSQQYAQASQDIASSSAWLSFSNDFQLHCTW